MALNNLSVQSSTDISLHNQTLNSVFENLNYKPIM